MINNTESFDLSDQEELNKIIKLMETPSTKKRKCCICGELADENEFTCPDAFCGANTIPQ